MSVAQAYGDKISDTLTRVLIDAVGCAGENLSILMDRQIRLQGTAVERVRLERLPDLLTSGERLVTAVYLAFSGDIDGHVMLTLAPEMAAQLAATLLMAPVADPLALDPMESSALGEVGNITAAAFLNAVAAACDLSVLPSPPTVVQDMVGALLADIIVEMAMESAYALLLHTVFEVEGERLSGDLSLLPTATACAYLEGVLS